MEQNEVIKIKVINESNKQVAIVELDSLQTLSDKIKKILKEEYSESLLVFVGSRNSKMDVETLYRICQTVQKIMGNSLEWRITDKTPESMELEDLSAYLILKTKKDE